MLVLFGGTTYTLLLYIGLRTEAPGWYWLVGVLELLGQVRVPTFFLLFPSGRFMPPWTRWGVLVFVLYFVWYIFRPPADLGQLSGLIGLVFAALLLGLVRLQVYRYRRISTFHERQQTKWVVFGITAVVIYFTMLIIIGTLNPEFTQANSLGSLFAESTYFLAFIIIPLTIAFSILRYRLWDIDLLINRTLWHTHRYTGPDLLWLCGTPATSGEWSDRTGGPISIGHY